MVGVEVGEKVHVACHGTAREAVDDVPGALDALERLQTPRRLAASPAASAAAAPATAAPATAAPAIGTRSAHVGGLWCCA
jgi:hypothetical protein